MDILFGVSKTNLFSFQIPETSQEVSGIFFAIHIASEGIKSGTLYFFIDPFFAERYFLNKKELKYLTIKLLSTMIYSSTA